MDNSILTDLQPDVKNFILADGVYPYNDPIDYFVVIIGGEEVAWCETQAQAQRSFIELIHYDAAHRQKCPDDYRPNPLLNICPAVKVHPFRIQQVEPSPVSRDSSGARIPLMGSGYRVVEC